MTEQAIKAKGTEFLRGDGEDPEEFTAIAELVNVGGPSMEADTIDVTTHDSEDDFREFKQGLKDGGEVTLELKFVPKDDTHDNVLGDFIDGQNRKYKIRFPDADTEEEKTSWTIRGFFTGFEPSAELEDDLTASLTLKVSGKPEFGNG